MNELVQRFQNTDFTSTTYNDKHLLHVKIEESQYL